MLVYSGFIMFFLYPTHNMCSLWRRPNKQSKIKYKFDYDFMDVHSSCTLLAHSTKPHHHRCVDVVLRLLLPLISFRHFPVLLTAWSSRTSLKMCSYWVHEPSVPSAARPTVRVHSFVRKATYTIRGPNNVCPKQPRLLLSRIQTLNNGVTSPCCGRRTYADQRCRIAAASIGMREG